MSEVDRRIQNPELAHHMGYAEYPYRELAAHALKLGMREAHDEAIAEGEKESLKAGREYIDTLSQNLEYHSDGNSSPEIKEAITGKLLGRHDFARFAEKRAEIQGREYHWNYEGKASGRAWNSLLRYHDKVSSGELLPVLKSQLEVSGSIKAPALADLGFESLVRFIDEYKNFHAAHPKVKPQQILGGYFGETAIDFISDFVDYTKEQSNKTEE